MCIFLLTKSAESRTNKVLDYSRGEAGYRSEELPAACIVYHEIWFRRDTTTRGINIIWTTVGFDDSKRIPILSYSTG
ncbi:hypothetical protein JR334_01160 [Clostridia bacterium]|nr:hypothetical protein JR334_01160 [Clostridia bacterium]